MGERTSDVDLFWLVVGMILLLLVGMVPGL